jgi:hypothetical protein
VIGTLTGNKMTGQWNESPTYTAPQHAGNFELTFTTPTHFDGKWGYGNTLTGGGWTGNKIWHGINYLSY